MNKVYNCWLQISKIDDILELTLLETLPVNGTE